MQKYFINENIELNKSFKIESSDQHHIEKVMRNKNGDQIICVDLKHIQYLCSIENVQEGTILPIEKLDINNELDVEVTLVYALPKGDKFEFVLQKACELGVHHIIPLSSKRCVVKLTKDKFNKKLPRYQKILKEADNYFTGTLHKLGTNSCGVGWNGDDAQRIRYDQLTRLIDFSEPVNVCDYGCGYGYYLSYLKYIQ